MSTGHKNKDYYSGYTPISFSRLGELGQRVDMAFCNLQLLDAAVFWMTNVERIKHGLKEFRFHYKLRQMATLHSEQMRKHGFFSHENPYEARYKTLDDRLDALKDNTFDGFMTYGENIAQYPTLNGPNSFTVQFIKGIPRFFAPDGCEILYCTCLEYAQKVVDGWMLSPGHRANILNPKFEYLGCGGAGFEQKGNSVSLLYFNLTQNFGGVVMPVYFLRTSHGVIPLEVGRCFTEPQVSVGLSGANVKVGEVIEKNGEVGIRNLSSYTWTVQLIDGSVRQIVPGKGMPAQAGWKIKFSNNSQWVEIVKHI